jgi:hypothetical protein
MVDESQPGLFEPQDSSETSIEIASSDSLPLPDGAVTFVLDPLLIAHGSTMPSQPGRSLRCWDTLTKAL